LENNREKYKLFYMVNGMGNDMENGMGSGIQQSYSMYKESSGILCNKYKDSNGI
jgi:hypothetical protein